MGFLKKLFKKNGNKADALYDDRTPETKATGKPVEAPAAKAPQKTENAAPAAIAPQKTESAAPAKPKKIEAEKSEKIEETEPEKGGKSEKSARSPFFEIKRAKDDRYVFNLYMQKSPCFGSWLSAFPDSGSGRCSPSHQ